MGLVIQFEATEEEVEEMMAQEQLNSTWKVFSENNLTVIKPERSSFSETWRQKNWDFGILFIIVKWVNYGIVIIFCLCWKNPELRLSEVFFFNIVPVHNNYQDSRDVYLCWKCSSSDLKTSRNPWQMNAKI